jgi:hypothetical protein
MQHNVNRRNSSPQELAIGRELLEQTFAPYYADNGDQVTVPHLVVYKVQHHFANGNYIHWFNRQVVNDERDYAL